MNQSVESVILKPEEIMIGQISYDELLSEMRL